MRREMRIPLLNNHCTTSRDEEYEIEGERLTLSKTKNHPPTLIKSLLEQYAITQNLTSRAEPRYYLLDEELGRACGVKKPLPGTKMSKDEILGKLRGGVVWSVSVGGVVK
jgi:translation initiation factor 2D